MVVVPQPMAADETLMVSKLFSTEPWIAPLEMKNINLNRSGGVAFNLSLSFKFNISKFYLGFYHNNI